jgi:hypothetical protein
MVRGRRGYSQEHRPLPFRAMLVSGAVLLALVVASGAYMALGGQNKAADLGSTAHSSARTAANPGGAKHVSSDRRGNVLPSTASSAQSEPLRGTSQASRRSRCGGARFDTPGGGDPWGGCWPGPKNTGPAAGTALSVYHGPCNLRRNTVIARKAVRCALSVRSGNLTLENSVVTGEVYNYGRGSVLIRSTTLNGGSDHTETVLGSNITILNSNLYGNQHEVFCDSNCTVENSWLHNNFNGAALGWHQNGFLSEGGSRYRLQHNSVYCVGGCTADIAFIPNDNISDATVTKNLFVATLDASYCLYPSSNSGKPGIVQEVTVTDNVFQRGARDRCAWYGPVSNWDRRTNRPNSDGYRNIWSGNRWVGGVPIRP